MEPGRDCVVAAEHGRVAELACRSSADVEILVRAVGEIDLNGPAISLSQTAGDWPRFGGRQSQLASADRDLALVPTRRVGLADSLFPSIGGRVDDMADIGSDHLEDRQMVRRGRYRPRRRIPGCCQEVCGL